MDLRDNDLCTHTWIVPYPQFKYFPLPSSTSWKRLVHLTMSNLQHCVVQTTYIRYSAVVQQFCPPRRVPSAYSPNLNAGYIYPGRLLLAAYEYSVFSDLVPVTRCTSTYAASSSPLNKTGRQAALAPHSHPPSDNLTYIHTAFPLLLSLI